MTVANKKKKWGSGTQIKTKRTYVHARREVHLPFERVQNEATVLPAHAHAIFVHPAEELHLIWQLAKN
jgi:hypothetical protein